MAENVVIGFLDILGFKEYIKSIKDNDIDNEFKNFNFFIERLFTREYTIKFENDITKSEKYSFGFFSDSIIVKYSYENDKDIFRAFLEVYMSLSVLQNGFLKFKSGLTTNLFLSRGGISFGKYCRNSNTIFSPAYIKAVELENETIFPYIKVDKVLIEKLIFVATNFEKKQFKLMVNKFLDNNFINPFNLLLVNNFIDTNGFFNESKKDMEKFNYKEKEDFLNEIILELNNKINTDKIKNNIKVKQKYDWFLAFIEWQEYKNVNDACFKDLTI